MIKPEVRKLMNLHFAIARETESDAQHDEQLNIIKGMIGYALANGDITPQQHANEWVMVKLARAQRVHTRNRKELSRA